MTGPQVDIRVTGPREDCELVLAALAHVVHLDRTGPARDRSTWPMVHVHATASITSTREGGAHADRR